MTSCDEGQHSRPTANDDLMPMRSLSGHKVQLRSRSAVPPRVTALAVILRIEVGTRSSMPG